MKGAALTRRPFQRHRRAVFSRHGQTGIYPPACPVLSDTQTNNHRRCHRYKQTCHTAAPRGCQKTPAE
ncbi:hypothetical protein C7B06_23840 [Escherichia coli]|nr:hypothetical protein C7B06_23840 [Escherichia coli]PSZ12053.1 hypothetical protein C7B07_23710 [Escherichia coli]